MRPAHSPGFLQPWDHEDNDQEDHQDGPDPLTGRAGVEHGNQRGQNRQYKEVSEPPCYRPSGRERLGERNELRDDRQSECQRNPDQGRPQRRAGRGPPRGSPRKGRRLARLIISKPGARSGSIPMISADEARSKAITCGESPNAASPTVLPADQCRRKRPYRDRWANPRPAAC